MHNFIAYKYLYVSISYTVNVFYNLNWECVLEMFSLKWLKPKHVQMILDVKILNNNNMKCCRRQVVTICCNFNNFTHFWIWYNIVQCMINVCLTWDLFVHNVPSHEANISMENKYIFVPLTTFDTSILYTYTCCFLSINKNQSFSNLAKLSESMLYSIQIPLWACNLMFVRV